ncbi:MAG: hypothetical protein OZ921_04090 [Sorangiineae bacterium]|nr:hypothetical protein [Polyangiaceae bacterium]MEB2321669.1 hypothetical protein [Sorangiineae bacterium]
MRHSSAGFLAALAACLASPLALAQVPPPAPEAPATPPSDSAAAPAGEPTGEKQDDEKKDDEKKDDEKKDDGAATGGGTPVAQPPSDAAPPTPPAPADSAPSLPPAPAVAPRAPAPAPAPAPVADPTADTSQTTKTSKLPMPEQTFGVELQGGTSLRLGSPDAYTNDAPVGFAYRLGGWYAPSRVFSLGLALGHAGLGSARTAPVGSSYEVARSMTALWLGGRAYPLRSDTIGLFVQLEVGLAFQHVRGTGATVANDGFAVARPYACSASQGPGFGLGGGVGVDVDLDRHLAFVAQADLTAARLASDPADLDGCAVGAGATSALGARIGFAYRFDLGDDRPASARGSSLGGSF